MPRFDPERSKRRNRRLMIIGGVLALIIGAGAALYTINSTSRDQAMTEQVVASEAAFESGDYEEVIALLEDRKASTNTIRAIQRDPAALYRYVQARLEVPLMNGEQFSLAFPALRQVVALDPQNLEAGKSLLGLQLAFDRTSDALATATRLIEVHPENAELLQYRASIYERMGRINDALTDVWASLEFEPLNVRATADAVRFSMMLNNDEPDRFANWAAEQLEKYPEDPRALIIHAQSMLMLKDRLQAEVALEKAAALEPTTTDVAQAIVEWLEMLGRFDLSRIYLAQQAGPGFESVLGEELLYRDYERGDYTKVVERFNQGNPDAASTDLLAIVAHSAQISGHDTLATSLLAQLRQSPEDYPKAWARVLDALAASPVSTRDVIAATSAALQLRPEQPHLNFILGNQLIELGEYEAAVKQLELSTRVRTAWARPRFLLARIALRYGETRSAAEIAENAVLRDPQVAYADLEAAARAYDADARDQVSRDRAANRIEQVQAQAPGSPFSLIALVDLYRRAGMIDQAKQTVTDALAIQPPLDRDTLARLSRQADAIDNVLAQQVRDRLASLYGSDPQVTLDRAIALADQGEVQKGREFIAAQTPEQAGPDWREVMARYLSYVNAPEATSAWIELADQYPNDLQIQTQAVNLIPVSEHVPFAERAISRMRELGGEQSIAWRIARGRLLIIGNQTPAPDKVAQAKALLTQAIETAPTRADAHELLSRVYELEKDIPSAIQSMQRSLMIQPDNVTGQYRLGTMLYQQRRYREAKQPLLRVAGDASAALDLRMSALTLLARQGELGLLIPIAQAMTQAKLGGVRAQILLTELYLAAGRLREAEQQAEAMLQSPSAESVAYLAEYFDRTGQPERAERTIALLDNMELPQSDRSEVLALFAARRNDQQTALSHFRAAAEAAPSDPARWRTLVSMDLLFLKPQVAIADAELARSAGINDPGILALLAHGDLIQELCIDPRFSRLAAAIVIEPEHRPAAIQAMQTIKQAATERKTLAEVARVIAGQAQSNADFLQLHHLATQLLLQSGLAGEAADIAVRSMERYPNDAESARLATLALIGAEDWRRAATAAANWGQRAPEYSNYADLLRATAQRNLGRYDDAIKTLQPYLDSAAANPENGFAVLREYIWALAQQGRIDQAWQLIEPRLPSESRWRQLAAAIAGHAINNTDTALNWTRAIADSTPQENIGERLILAQARFDLATRLSDDAMLEQARVDIEQILAMPDPPLEALYIRGMIAEAAGNLALAEEAYRKLLQQNPQAHPAMNNLAMILLQRGRELDQALRYANDAIRAQPNEANYLDTLAQIHAARREYPQALAAADRAIQLAPNTPGWYLTKADILEASGDTASAQVIRERYEPGR